MVSYHCCYCAWCSSVAVWWWLLFSPLVLFLLLRTVVFLLCCLLCLSYWCINVVFWTFEMKLSAAANPWHGDRYCVIIKTTDVTYSFIVVSINLPLQPPDNAKLLTTNTICITLSTTTKEELINVPVSTLVYWCCCWCNNKDKCICWYWFVPTYRYISQIRNR